MATNPEIKLLARLTELINGVLLQIENTQILYL